MTSTTLTASDECCPLCYRRGEAGATWWVLRSSHRTSEGEVEYCYGRCGCLVILLAGELVKVTPGGPPH
ncbi:hypothetical protein GCM10010329_34180 [Streptomyces spiroverticillatus]|uniref:Uncharacterized protein n=1 Tax=Streptomyces finlayi TaxID=67296 RepID=A0A919C9H3_9ACTN|nr:hypothetical protein [Streptomyces finlayi]GHA08567.1 hypothetical protein GCM10010329_34180 [Streptomyces spiroverticillatus]GHC91505.1 hypothetical protein GCM10010334_26590 [Streptomyces finlayi]